MVTSNTWGVRQTVWRWLSNLTGTQEENKADLSEAFIKYGEFNVRIGTSFDEEKLRPSAPEDMEGFGIYVRDVEDECRALQEDITNLEHGHDIMK